MDNMFNQCTDLTSLDISNFNLENDINTSSMFEDCWELGEKEFNNDTLTKNLEEMESLFSKCK